MASEHRTLTEVPVQMELGDATWLRNSDGLIYGIALSWQVSVAGHVVAAGVAARELGDNYPERGPE